MWMTYSKLWSLSLSRTTLYGGCPFVFRFFFSRGRVMVLVIVGSLCLPALPLRLALLEEGAHSLLGVGERGVEGHNLLGVRVRLLDGHLDLAVESLLPDPNDERAGTG